MPTPDVALFDRVRLHFHHYTLPLLDGHHDQRAVLAAIAFELACWLNTQPEDWFITGMSSDGSDEDLAAENRWHDLLQTLFQPYLDARAAAGLR